MSQWQKIREMEECETLQQIQSLFDESFPIEFRHFFAEDLEKSNWKSIDPDEPSHETLALDMLNYILNRINSHCNNLLNLNEIETKNHFYNIYNKFKTTYSSNPLEFVRLCRRILNSEVFLINQYQANKKQHQQHQPQISQNQQEPQNIPNPNHKQVNNIIITTSNHSHSNSPTTSLNNSNHLNTSNSSIHISTNGVISANTHAGQAGNQIQIVNLENNLSNGNQTFTIQNGGIILTDNGAISVSNGFDGSLNGPLVGVGLEQLFYA